MNTSIRIQDVETVRCAIIHKDKCLLLIKDKGSKNPNGLEFPGGKIDGKKKSISSLFEQKKTTIKEVKEETGINIEDLKLYKLKTFTISFIVKKGNHKETYKRKVHFFIVVLRSTIKYSVLVGKTKDKKGGSEDKHSGYIWIKLSELEKLPKEKDQKSTITKKNTLAQNSSKVSLVLDFLKKHPKIYKTEK